MRTSRKRTADPAKRGVVGTGGKCREACNIRNAQATRVRAFLHAIRRAFRMQASQGDA